MSQISDREISITRIFDVSRELMFKVWTEPEHIALWWGPNGFTNTIHSMEVKPEGQWKFIMHGPDGTDYPNLVTYKEIKKPELITYVHGEKGQPGYFFVTVKFEDVGGKTKLSMTMLFDSAQERNEVAEKYGAVEGLKQNMDKLEIYLQKNLTRGK